MRTRQLLIGGLLLACCALTNAADRYQTLLNAKHLTLTTRQGDTYYYIISTEATPMLRLGGDRVVVERDTFLVSDIKWMRLRTIPRFVLDEDSLTFGRDYAVDHGLLALRRSLVVNQWNSLVLPVELTGEQVRQVFGDDAQVAQVRGFHEGSNTQVDYELIDLSTRSAAMLANCHYIVRPTREPDLAAGQAAQQFGSVRPEGPLWLIADATLQERQAPTLPSFRSDDRSARLALQGTYIVRDGSTTVNRKLPPNVYCLDGDGTFSQSADSVAVKAFSSWFTDTSSEPQSMTFYVDGINENLSAIFGLTADRLNPEGKAPTGVYDMQGRRITTSFTSSPPRLLKKGLYIINGKKTIIR